MKDTVKMIIGTFFKSGYYSGYGVYSTILRFGEYTKNILGPVYNTSNRRTIIEGIIAGISALKYPCNIEIILDNQYVADVANGARKITGSYDLWNKYKKCAKGHNVTFRVLDESVEQEKCDHEAAVKAAIEFKPWKKPSVCLPDIRKVSGFATLVEIESGLYTIEFERRVNISRNQKTWGDIILRFREDDRRVYRLFVDTMDEADELFDTLVDLEKKNKLGTEGLNLMNELEKTHETVLF